VVDGQGGTVAATQSFILAAVNDAPTGTASATLAGGTEDTAYTVSAADLLAGFTDVDGDPLSVADLTSTKASVANNGDGTFTITPVANANGPVTLTYSVVDGQGGTVAATQSFILAAVNDAPPVPVDTDVAGNGAGNQRASISEHLELGSAIGIDANASDVDGDSVEYYFKDASGLRSQTSGHFAIDALTGVVTLATNVNYELSTSHTLTIWASDGQLESSSTFTVNVENVDEHLFTAQADTVDFNTLTAGSYDIDGGEYLALAGDDQVVLPTLATSALAGHAWNYATTFDAGDGNDTVTGRDGNDRIRGGNGDDVLSGGDGSDILSGDAGNDTVLGGAGTDQLHGGDGADRIEGGSENDLITGGAGNDDVWGDGGNDTIGGGDGDDTLRGNEGDDNLVGDLGSDWLYGGNGSDYLDGGEMNDRLFGGSGDDRLVGGAGDDILAGGVGIDKLTGSSGKDIFVFTDTELGTTKRGAHDVITDFQQGTDKIDISALFDGGSYGGLKAGALSGRPADAYKVGFYSETGKTWLEGDTNGDGAADFVIELTGAYKLTGTDFLVSQSLLTAQGQWTTATGGLDWSHFHNDVSWA
jgi:Ca2+-binding RTX toxin-like protein